MNLTVEELIYLLHGYKKDLKVVLVNAKTAEGYQVLNTSKEAGFNGPQVTIWFGK